MPKISSSCCVPTMRGLHSTIWLKFGKQTVFEEAEEPEPRHKERAMRVSMLAEGLRLVEAGVKVLQNINSKK